MNTPEVLDLMIRAEREHTWFPDAERRHLGVWERRCNCGRWLARNAWALRNHQQYEAAHAISQALQETPTYLV